MKTRTDIHRPSAPTFDPTEYECRGVFYLGESPGVLAIIVGSDRNRHRQMIEFLQAQGYTQGGVYGSRACSHCSAYLSYTALMVHTPTKTYLHVGEDCLMNRFELDSAAEFQALRKEMAASRKQQKIQDKIETLVASHPLLAELTYLDGIGDRYSDFIADVALRFRQYGELSERQIEAVEAQIIRTVERQARRDAERAASTPAPLGRHEVVGKVVSVKIQEGYFEGTTTWKMLVVADAGYRVWATIPSNLEDLAPGMRVKFTATLALTKNDSDPDPGFVIGSRPSKAEIL
jgi:ribosomal protein S13